MSLSTLGLIVFVISVIVSFGVLIFDAVRRLRGKKTVTQWATERPWRAAILVCLALMGVVGLIVHFVFFTG